MIHRKNTTARLKKLLEIPECYSFPREDLEDALAVIDAQNELLSKIGTNSRNARKGNRDAQKAIARHAQSKECWVNRTQIAERRYELLRNKLWDVEDMLRNLGLQLKSESILSIVEKHKQEERRNTLLNDLLEKTISNELNEKK